MKPNKVRRVDLDLIRCLALFCVVAVHFFKNSSFYSLPVTGKFMFFMCLLRNSFMICVPLFLLLTGYLITTTKPTKQYYSKLIRILGIYVLAAVCVGIYKVFIAKTGLTVEQAILGLFTFTTAQYVWYVEMYIGLFLLIPFLNLLYENLKSIRHQQLLILSLLVLTMLPSVTNIWCFDDPAWWRQPSTSAAYLHFLPTYWIILYPITYFYLGRYLREHPIALRPAVQFALMAVIFLAAGAFRCYRSYGGTYYMDPGGEYGSLALTLQSVAVFSFFTSLSYDRVPKPITNILARLSDWSFGAYLLSWIFDHAVYTHFLDPSADMRQQFLCFAFVPAIFLAASLLSGVVNWFYDRTLGRLAARIRNS